jgi:neutral ceramidase
MVLVTADLFAIPGGLQAEVARRVADQLARRRLPISLPREAIVLAATHTHQGPGNYMTARSQNQFGSTYSGFSRILFDFLATRISRAVVEAIEQGLFAPGQVRLNVHTLQVDHELIRSRSPRPFQLNRDREELLAWWNADRAPLDCQARSGEPFDFWDPPECLRLRAVDRTLTVLEIVRGGERVGLLVFFAVHPTVLPAETPFYSPDFVGVALAGYRHPAAGTPIVAGFFNGADGDVVTRRTSRGLADAERLGRAFRSWIDKALSKPPVMDQGDEVEIHVQAVEWLLDGQSNRTCQDGTGSSRLSAFPILGTPALGGAEGDWTQLHVLGWREGVRDRPSAEQGVKLPALDSQILRAMRFTESFATADAFPDRFPLVVARLGQFTVAAVPLELTSAQGNAVRRVLGDPAGGRVEIVGLANEYHGYCTSEDEYVAQYYEGGMTWWGPEEGNWLVCRLRQLAAGVELARSGVTEERTYHPGNPGAPNPVSSVLLDGPPPPSWSAPCDRPFGPSFAGMVRRPDEGLDALLADGGPPDRGLPWFEWNEEEPNTCNLVEAPTRSVSVLRLDSARGRWVMEEDDTLGGTLTVHMFVGRWSAIWRHAPGGGAGPFLFRVQTTAGCLCSAPFDGPPRTTLGRQPARDCPPGVCSLAAGQKPGASSGL